MKKTEATFETIYKGNYGKLFTLAFRMTGNKEDAEDVLQTSFLSAYRAYDRFKHESSVSTWLYRIVLNASKKYHWESRKLPVDKYAEENNISQAEVYEYINSFGKVEEEALTTLTRETCLQMFMNCMPPKYRAVYTLRCMLYFSVKETAQILEISENNVKVNLNRARKIIQSHFHGRCSLIQPSSMCDCRSYAKFMVESGQTNILLNVERIKNKERTATDEFAREMTEILEIEGLYSSPIKPPDYPELLKKIKALSQENRIKILNYS